MATESPIRIMGQNFQEKQRNLGPNRSGSAPPSMEGSFAAIKNLMSRHIIATNRAEEQLRADPSYFEYYSTHVNLNPRLPPPLISDQNQNLFHNNVADSTSNPRLTSFDDSSQSNLSPHKEESDDDQSTKQENFPQDSSYLQNQSIHESTESSVSHSEDDVSSITNGLIAINMSSIQNTESQSQSQQRSMFLQPQIASQGQTYIGMNQFLHDPNFELQRILQSAHYATDSPYIMSGNHIYPNMYYPQQYSVSGYAYNPPYVSGYLPTNPVHMPFDQGQSQSQSQSQPNFQHFNKFYGHPGLQFQPQFTESLHLSTRVDDPLLKQHHLGIMSPNNLNSRRLDSTNPYYFGSPTTHTGMLQFPNTSPYASPPVPGSPIAIAGARFQRNGPRPYGGNTVFKDPKTYSFLEELKSGKGRRLDLSDIFGHIVEFCGDQHGSRFIQQKLEICSIEEKELVFKEVLPNASTLITDVFGNYVIQKFFEYGNGEQRKELANQLEGQMLPLSLQMYGCRVIQKALDVIEVEQKIKLVNELDGHVLRCVRDQNGNHVIQKCIERISMDKIEFVLSSFRGQVAALSTHPYGCRVIQRVLEHSTDELQSQFIVDEILESVYTLSQDQYGNYVTQHVLKRGSREERRQIVQKLAGHVVQLSQHKFASNVIEKCLEYGDSVARGILIEEIIGLGEDNDNLLAMVKDQFANYVIQKVVQTCTNDQREVLLGRIKIHLHSLKKYSFGKHIVTRFEQLYGEEVEAFDSLPNVEK